MFVWWAVECSKWPTACESVGNVIKSVIVRLCVTEWVMIWRVSEPKTVWASIPYCRLGMELRESAFLFHSPCIEICETPYLTFVSLRGSSPSVFAPVERLSWSIRNWIVRNKVFSAENYFRAESLPPFFPFSNDGGENYRSIRNSSNNWRASTSNPCSTFAKNRPKANFLFYLEIIKFEQK